MLSSSLRFTTAALCVIEGSNAFSPVKSTLGAASTATAANGIERPSSPSPMHIDTTPFALDSPRSVQTSLQGVAVESIPDLEWIPLVDAADEDEVPAVRKHIVEEGDGDVPADGANIELEYTGTLLGEKDWSTNDVVECWLSQLQGLDHLAPKFIENQIDGSKLLDETFFTEEYCTEHLGISNKIQAKKLIMASRRLAKRQEEYAPGTEFDSSISRGQNYSFVLGAGKVIKAMELGVGSMRVGERCLVVCRADYGYGSEGLRTSKGGVMVPPFATLCFELKLVGST